MISVFISVAISIYCIRREYTLYKETKNRIKEYEKYNK